ncbi:MAG: replicative DNA helicase [Clostridia bacterium]|nr:replicative DNA helicase [Clostridia bacterium]
MEKEKKKVIARTIPHNIEAEQSVLGCCLLDDNAVLGIMEALEKIDFYTESHKTVFECMQTIYKENKPIDYVTLTDELERRGLLEKVGGIEYITTLTNIVPSAANAKHYVDIVKRDSTLRKLIKASQDVIDKAYSADGDNVLDFAEKSIFDISEKEDRSNLEPITNSLGDVLNKFEQIDKNGGGILGVSTGFSDLDRITRGFQKSDLILLAARPGFGKTSLAMNIVNYAALKGKKKCAVFSLEMPREQITQRTLCSVSAVSMEKALSGKLSQTDWKSLWEGNKKLSTAEIFIDDSSLNSYTDILSKCRRLKREYGLDLVMIDYLQLMSAPNRISDRQQEIATLTKNLKVAAKELAVPILLLSQLSRDVEKRKDEHRPVLSDLRESGAIEQDADIVMFIYNASKYSDTELTDGPNVCELIIAKHRNGALGTVKLKWIPEITTFVDMSESGEKRSLEEMAPPPPPPMDK